MIKILKISSLVFLSGCATLGATAHKILPNIFPNQAKDFVSCVSGLKMQNVDNLFFHSKACFSFVDDKSHFIFNDIGLMVLKNDNNFEVVGADHCEKKPLNLSRYDELDATKTKNLLAKVLQEASIIRSSEVKESHFLEYYGPDEMNNLYACDRLDRDLVAKIVPALELRKKILESLIRLRGPIAEKVSVVARIKSRDKSGKETILNIETKIINQGSKSYNVAISSCDVTSKWHLSNPALRFLKDSKCPKASTEVFAYQPQQPAREYLRIKVPEDLAAKDFEFTLGLGTLPGALSNPLTFLHSAQKN